MDNATQPMPVVVGIGGSGRAQAAIRLAALEATFRRAPLIAVTAYSSAPVLGAPAARPVSTLRTTADDRVNAESDVADELRAALGDEADGVEVQVVPGLPGRALVEAAMRIDAQLIVLATRRSTSTLLGAVSQFVLRNAPCPVLVVPDALAA